MFCMFFVMQGIDEEQIIIFIYMIKNFILIAVRNLFRNRLYGAINILGLSIGLACALLIALFLRHELNADKHHAHYESLYRLGVEMGLGGSPTIKASLSSYPIGPDMKENFPEVVDFTRFYYLDAFHSDMLVEYEDKAVYESGVVLADSSFLDLFTHPVIYGDAKASLRKSRMAVLTRSAAERLFGPGDPVGRSFRLNQTHQMQVGAVIEDIPDNSHLKFRILLFWDSMPGSTGHNMARNSYFENNIYTYVKINEGADIKGLRTRMDELVESRTRSIFIDNNLQGTFRMHLRPMKELYFIKSEQYQPTNPEPIPAKGDMTYVYVFMAIAVFLTAIASINYMNMAIARSGRRSKEVGVRKVLGAESYSLMGQFLAESVIVAFLALLLALAWVELSLPVFNNLLMKNLSLRLFQDPEILMISIGFTALVGLLSGSYPALYLSGFQPLAVLKQQVRLSDRNLNLRKIMVALQFTISIFMIIATLVVLQQLHYIRNKDLGYQTGNILILSLNDLEEDQRMTLKKEMEQLAAVSQACLSYDIPGPGKMVSNNGVSTESEEGFTDRLSGVYRADASFASLFDIEMRQGRFFDSALETDYTQAVVINETAARTFGWDDQALGKRFMNTSGDDTLFQQVIGVISDFHVYSIDMEIGSLVIFPKKTGDQLSLKVQPGNEASALKQVEAIWKDHLGSLPMRYRFMNENHRVAYLIHTNQGRLFAIFALLCIILSLMGLFGLSGFSAEQKNREIGIRKVHGATLKDILSLLYKEYIGLMIVSVMVASVLGGLVMEQWLSRFAFNTGLSIGPFFMAAALAFSVSLLTVGYHAVRCAGENPVKALYNGSV